MKLFKKKARVRIPMTGVNTVSVCGICGRVFVNESTCPSHICLKTQDTYSITGTENWDETPIPTYNFFNIKFGEKGRE